MFPKATSPLCSLCTIDDETVLHLFYECDVTQNLWKGLALFFGNDCTLFDLTPQAAFLGFLSANLKQFLIQN